MPKRIRIPKRYGESRADPCPFCSEQSTTTNKQGVPVCQRHKVSTLSEMKCVCGEYLEMKTGKFGIYFSCMNCGNMNLKKVLEFNTVEDKSENPVKKQPKEIVIRSDDPRYF